MHSFESVPVCFEDPEANWPISLGPRTRTECSEMVEIKPHGDGCRSWKSAWQGQDEVMDEVMDEGGKPPVESPYAGPPCAPTILEAFTCDVASRRHDKLGA